MTLSWRSSHIKFELPIRNATCRHTELHLYLQHEVVCKQAAGSHEAATNGKNDFISSRNQQSWDDQDVIFISSPDSQLVERSHRCFFVEVR